MLDDDAFGLGGRGRKSFVKEWTDPANGATMKTACAYAFDAVGRVSTIKQSNNGVAVPDIAFTCR